MAFLSAPGWTLAVMAVLTIARQLSMLLDPSRFMKSFNIPNASAARVISLCVILINGYDLIGALRDDWVVYWYSLVSRLVATALYACFEPAWGTLAKFEFATFVILGVGMVAGRG